MKVFVLKNKFLHITWDISQKIISERQNEAKAIIIIVWKKKRHFPQSVLFLAMILAVIILMDRPTG